MNFIYSILLLLICTICCIQSVDAQIFGRKHKAESEEEQDLPIGSFNLVEGKSQTFRADDALFEIDSTNTQLKKYCNGIVSWEIDLIKYMKEYEGYDINSGQFNVFKTPRYIAIGTKAIGLEYWDVGVYIDAETGEIYAFSIP